MPWPSGTAHMARKPKPTPSPPIPTPRCHSPPHPHRPFRADPFSRSFSGPIKRLAHSLHSKMCNVREVSEGGRVRWGMESRKGGGEIPKRLRISQPKRSQWTSHSATQLMSRIVAKQENSGRRRKEKATNAAQNNGCATLCTHNIITIFQPDIYYCCIHSLIIPQ